MHIIQRGNNRGLCFFTDAERQLYLAQLAELSRRDDREVHAYCLMSNHVHLLVTPLRDNSCALLMKNLGQRYVQYVNRAYRRTGSLWEGRFRSCLAQSQRYVLACYRYIELNPVRAAIVDHPGKYPWSSYRANAEVETYPLVTPHPEYLALGHEEATRKKTYRACSTMRSAPNWCAKSAPRRTAGTRSAAKRSRDCLGEPQAVQ